MERHGLRFSQSWKLPEDFLEETRAEYRKVSSYESGEKSMLGGRNSESKGICKVHGRAYWSMRGKELHRICIQYKLMRTTSHDRQFVKCFTLDCGIIRFIIDDDETEGSLMGSRT